MASRGSQFAVCKQAARSIIAILCSISLIAGQSLAMPAQSDATQQQSAKLPPEQLDSLVAPIALYPDPLLSQTLVASTYPLEVIQLQQWLAQHKDLKDKALTDAVQKQDWDPSIQAMAALPDVAKQLAENIKWTTDLGNAFLAQQSDVMDAVQRMRAKAKNNGNLKSGEQQKVETTVIESKQVIVIQQSNPQVVYVPSYNPVVVYGAPIYPYPPIYYPPASYYAAGMAISFGVGLAIGAAWHGGWGYGCGWGHSNNNITINNNNNFVNNSNRNNYQGGNRNQINGGNNWQHNPQHRGGAPYSDRATANKYGGSARGDSMQNRQASARQNQARQQGSAGNRGGASAGTADRGANRNASANNRSTPSAGTTNRGATQNANANNRGGSSAGTMDRGSSRASSSGTGAGGGDRVGNRSVPSSSGSRSSSSAFGGGSGASASASSSRGSSSFGGGGGRSSGGGGRSSGGRR